MLTRRPTLLRCPRLPQATIRASPSVTECMGLAHSTNLQEGLASLSNLLARVLVDVLFADVSTPLLDNFLLEDIGLVEAHEDLGDGRNELGMGVANKALDATKERLLVLLRRDKLQRHNKSRLNLQVDMTRTFLNRGALVSISVTIFSVKRLCAMICTALCFFATPSSSAFL